MPRIGLRKVPGAQPPDAMLGVCARGDGACPGHRLPLDSAAKAFACCVVCDTIVGSAEGPNGAARRAAGAVPGQPTPKAWRCQRVCRGLVPPPPPPCDPSRPIFGVVDNVHTSEADVRVREALGLSASKTPRARWIGLPLDTLPDGSRRVIGVCHAHNTPRSCPAPPQALRYQADATACCSGCSEAVTMSQAALQRAQASGGALMRGVAVFDRGGQATAWTCNKLRESRGVKGAGGGGGLVTRENGKAENRGHTVSCFSLPPLARQLRAFMADADPRAAAAPRDADVTYHTPAWHAARLAALTTERVSWEDFKAKQKLDAASAAAAEAESEEAQRAFRAQLDADRAAALARGVNQGALRAELKAKEKRDARRKDKKKKRRLRSRSRERRRRRSRSRSREGRRRRSRSREKRRRRSSSSESDRPRRGRSPPPPAALAAGDKPVRLSDCLQQK